MTPPGDPATGDPAPAEEATEERLREAFAAAVQAAPPSPEPVRARLAELQASAPPKRGRVTSSAIRLTGLAAALAAVVVVALIGSWTIASTPRPEASTAASTPAGSPPLASPGASGSPAADIGDDFFVPDQVTSGDGWRLIAGRRGLDGRPPTLVPRITMYTGAGMVKPVELLDLPSVEAIADQQTEGLLVIDFVVGGGGGICGQIRLDGVTFDLARAEVTVRYVAWPDAQPNSVVACAGSATPVTIVLAIARDHLAAGQDLVSLVRSSPSSGEVVEGTSTIVGAGEALPPAAASPADAAGRFGAGGIWATHGTTLERSIDGGATWETTTMPVKAVPFVLDRESAWLASPSSDSTDFTGSKDDVLHYMVDRTTDGGRTWARSTVPGNVPGTLPVFAFADPLHGYLLAAGERGSFNEALYRTADGGATWEVVPTKGPSTGQFLGDVFGLGPAGSLWAGTQGDAGPVERPVLDVSRDGGRTWTDARLPGLEGQLFATNTVLAPPAFFGNDGVVAVTTEGETGITLRTFATTDGGRTWAARSPAATLATGSGFAAASALVWIAAGDTSDTIVVTDDAGRSWHSFMTAGIEGTGVSWLGFTDPLIGAAIIWLGDGPHSSRLVVTSDGGRTWVRAGYPASPPAP